MPKKSNQESNSEEKPILTNEAGDQQEMKDGETGFAPEYDSYEPTSRPEQVETNAALQQPSNQPVNGQSRSQRSQNNMEMRSETNGYGSGRAEYKKWGQTMQMQSDSTQFENSAQSGFNYAQLLTLGDAKRLVSLLGGVYLAIYGLSRSLGSLIVASAGLGLLYYALTGQWPLTNRNSTGHVNQGGRGSSGANSLHALRANADSITTKNIIVKAPLHDIYQAWANFENFPNFMQHIKSVVKTGDRTSHWVMEGPLNTEIEWDAETTRLEENKRIAWSSITGDIKTSGQVTFNELAGNEVEVTVMLKYVPPAGLAGEIVAELFSNPEGKLVEDLRNFKRTIEAKQPQLA